MSGNRRVILHAGAHKTASSLIQRALASDEGRLLEHGLSVVHRPKVVASDFSRILAQIVITGTLPDEKETAVASESFAALVESDAPATLLTNEDFFEIFRSPRFYKNIGTALKWLQALSHADLRLILFTRSQPSYIESMYMQRVHLGDSDPFQSVADLYSELNMSWTRALDDASRVIGREHITAIPYEAVFRIGTYRYYQTFLNACGVYDEELTISEDMERARSANRSYSGEAMKLALAINPLVEPKNRGALRKFLQENYSTATHPRAQLYTPTERQEVLAKYQLENERLFSDYLSDWREDSSAYGLEARKGTVKDGAHGPRISKVAAAARPLWGWMPRRVR